jgi:hypothetical protein
LINCAKNTLRKGEQFIELNTKHPTENAILTQFWLLKLANDLEKDVINKIYS